ncbi:hypothetical protein BMS3Abin04_01543 [bacterium BMS3Abin04]|nr:hypothetical protein BMS3Abin04_01543 [bacterium BMS3Abin04]
MKKRFLFILLSYVLLSLNAGCNNSVSEPNLTFTAGKYSYTAFNKNNNIVASGYFTISINDSIIKGVKNIQNTISDEQPEAGEGDIHGRIIGLNQIEIYLTETGGPYLIINGNYKDMIIEGHRIFGSSTSAWVDTLGIFRAELLE